jgi:hypothetical protein
MSKQRNSELKPLLLTTTLRNPERIKDFLKILIKYNGQTLSNELIMRIVFDVIFEKLYKPNYISKKTELNAIYNENNTFTENQVLEIIKNSPQNHKEAGFDKGWPSRFDTWFKFIKELGFIYYKFSKPIEVSETGFNLASSDQPEYRHLEAQVFLNSFVKYHRINPYRKVSNSNKPFILLLQVIKELNRVYGETNPGISTKEIPLIICWKDSDYLRLVDKIKEIRKKYSFNPSSEFIYDVCKSELNLANKDEKRFKLKNIINEMPDEFIRKMRLTGLISIRGMGRYLDLNKIEENKINYVLSKYQTLNTFVSEEKYFTFMKEMDSELISVHQEKIIDKDKFRILFEKWVNEFDFNVISDELAILTDTKKSSKHNLFKFINAPLRLEFLTALALQKKLPRIEIKPNYKVDDEGIPISFAQGGEADIICLSSNGNVLFEVTMLSGTQQNIREMPSITRHLREIISQSPKSFSVLVAPTIHSDTYEYSDFVKTKFQLIVIPITIQSFISTVKEIETLESFRKLQNENYS